MESEDIPTAVPAIRERARPSRAGACRDMHVRLSCKAALTLEQRDV
jgi:hypothetical protein